MNHSMIYLTNINKFDVNRILMNDIDRQIFRELLLYNLCSLFNNYQLYSHELYPYIIYIKINADVSVIIDLMWKYNFDIFKKTDDYTVHFNRLPIIYVNTETNYINSLKCEFSILKINFDHFNMEIPPWRKSEYFVKIIKKIKSNIIDKNEVINNHSFMKYMWKYGIRLNKIIERHNLIRMIVHKIKIKCDNADITENII